MLIASFLYLSRSNWIIGFLFYKLPFKKSHKRDFPGGAVVKNPSANAGDAGLSPGLGRSHMPQSN